jgi:hypothetical protein
VRRRLKGAERDERRRQLVPTPIVALAELLIWISYSLAAGFGMTWLHTLNYFGPDRRAKRQVRIVERRSAAAAGERAALRDALRANGLGGARWIDHPSYFGLDRRSGNFSHYILERRRDNCASAPPRLAGALRQLRVRVLEAEDPRTRGKFFDRVRATALLADAQNHSAIGDLLLAVADRPSRANAGAQLQAALLRAEDKLACGE